MNLSTGSFGVAFNRPSRWLRRAATTQFPDCELIDGDLRLRLPDAGSAVRAALEMRNWIGDGPPAGGGIGIAPSPDGAEAAGGLAALAGPGVVLAEAQVVKAADQHWVASRPQDGRTAAELTWHGPGEPASGLAALPDPVTSSIERPWPLLGREEELVELAMGWRGTAGGGLRVHLIAGEPGAGKTRLAAEAGREVRRAGGLVLHAGAGGPGSPPYAPFAELAGQVIAREEAGAGRLAGSRFGRMLTGGGSEQVRRPSGGLGDERAVLFRSVVEELEALSAHAPMLVICEDLHAWGTGSLLLLEHICRVPVPLNLMVLGTYRPTALDPAGEPAAAVSRLRELGGARHTELGGLDLRALHGIAAFCGDSIDSADLQRAAESTLAETAGNSLFACELLRAGRFVPEAFLASAPTAEAPPSLQMLIAARTHALGERAYEHLSGGAVVGRSFDPGILALALDADPTAVHESLELGVRAGLVVPEGNGRFTFTHSIVARSLYQEAGPGFRGRVHRRVGVALEELDPATVPVAQLAHHWSAAEPADAERASRYAADAAEQALLKLDHQEAAGWFERALELRPGSAEEPAAERCAMLTGLGTALRFSGDPRFREILLEASRLAAETGQLDQLVDAALANNRGFVSSIGEHDQERVALLELALERIDPKSPQRALLLAQLALELTFFAHHRERRRALADDALAAARAAGDELILSRVLLRRLIACWSPDDARQRISDAGESISISSRLDEPLDLFHGLHWQGVAQIEVGDVEGAARNLLAQTRIAERLGDSTALWLSACGESLRVAMRGRLEEAEALAGEGLELGRQGSQPDALAFFASQIASIRWQQGRLPELLPILIEALENHPGLPAFRSLLALAHALAGERDAGRAAVDVDAVSHFSELPIDPVWLPAITTYAHAVAELEQIEHAELLSDMLAPYAGLISSTSVSLWGTVDHALGRLAALRGDHAEAELLLGRAVNEYRRMSAPVWCGHGQLDLVRTRMLGGAPPRSQDDLLAEVRNAGRRHGAGLLLVTFDERSQEREEDRRAGLDAVELAASLGITVRQAEVVGLLARGKTNAAIARELAISPSTVKRHLENVFDRVGVRTRGELLAQLLDPEAEATRPTSA